MEATSADSGVKWWLLWLSLSGSSILLSPLVWSYASWGIWPLWKSFQKDHELRCELPGDCLLSDFETAVKASHEWWGLQLCGAVTCPAGKGRTGVWCWGQKAHFWLKKKWWQECGCTEANHKPTTARLWCNFNESIKLLSKQVSAKCFSGWMHNHDWRGILPMESSTGREELFQWISTDYNRAIMAVVHL